MTLATRQPEGVPATARLLEQLAATAGASLTPAGFDSGDAEEFGDRVEALVAAAQAQGADRFMASCLPVEIIDNARRGLAKLSQEDATARLSPLEVAAVDSAIHAGAGRPLMHLHRGEPMGPGVSGPWATYLAQGLGLLRRTAASVGRIGVRQCQFRYHGAGFVIGHGLLLTMGYPAAPEVFFVGGAFEGARSAEVMAELFLHQFGVKRLAPGRITTLPPDLPSASATFAYDATRLAGCAGAPIIDFQRGQALGVHVGQDAAGGNLGQATCHLITELRLAGAAHF